MIDVKRIHNLRRRPMIGMAPSDGIPYRDNLAESGIAGRFPAAMRTPGEATSAPRPEGVGWRRQK